VHVVEDGRIRPTKLDLSVKERRTIGSRTPLQVLIRVRVVRDRHDGLEIKFFCLMAERIRDGDASGDKAGPKRRKKKKTQQERDG